MANPTLTIGNYTFDPVPVVSIDKQWLRTESGRPINILKTATFTGTLATYNKSEPTYDPLVLQRRMDNELCNCNKCVNMTLMCDTETIIDAWVRIQSINWGESPDNWTITIPITVTVEWDEAQDNMIPSGDPDPCLSCIRSVNDTWNFQYLDAPAAYNLEDVNCPSGVQFLQFDHTVEAQAVDCCSGVGGLTSGYVLAQSWVNDHLGFDRTCFNGIPGFGFDTSTDNFGICGHTRVGTLNKLGGAYSVNESFTISSPALDCCSDDWTVECQKNNQSRLTTYTINGTITGFETRDPSDFHVITTTKIEQARACWNSIKNDLDERVACVCSGTPGDCVVNPIPTSSSVGFSPTQGTVTYNYTYDNRPLSIIENARYENITISDILPSETVVEIPIPGRTAGPILKSCFTQPARRKSLSIEVIFPFDCDAVSGVDSQCTRFNNMQITQVQSDDVTDFVCCVENQLAAVNDFVSRVEDSHSLTLQNGIYTRNVVWVYQDCSDGLPAPCP